MDEIISSHVVEFVGVIVIYCSALDLFLKITLLQLNLLSFVQNFVSLISLFLEFSY